MRQENTENGLSEKLKSEKGYYEIRLESIGGLGANLCGKMLGELGLKYLDLNSSSFSSYGSEKTGTPVKAFIRYCAKEKEIRVHSPVTEPDLLVIFHQALLNEEEILSGCGENTVILVALEQGQQFFQNGKLPFQTKLEKCSSKCYGLEAQKIAMETHSRINVVMLGATLRIMGMKDWSMGEQICRDTLGKKYPDALSANLLGIRRGYEEVKKMPSALLKTAEESRTEKVQETKAETKAETEAETKSETKEAETKQAQTKQAEKKQAQWGYETAPIGGINPRIGSTAVADHSPSRQGYIPLFIKERCINCGLCHSACPDMVFQFARGEYKGRERMVNTGLDYYHCKGCLRCVEVCPVNALVKGVEAEHPNKKYFVPNQELLRTPEYYEEAGADGYITSESYLTEKRMEGGEV